MWVKRKAWICTLCVRGVKSYLNIWAYFFNILARELQLILQIIETVKMSSLFNLGRIVNARLCLQRHPQTIFLHRNYLQFLQTIPADLLPELPFTSGTCVWWSRFADKASAPFEPCTRECVSHAKWRTVVVYGQSNIVLGCLCCTWWYGANRGICQMQSGVMEGRDTVRWNREQGREKGEGTAWAAPGSL